MEKPSPENQKHNSAPCCSGRVTLSVLDSETTVATKQNGSYHGSIHKNINNNTIPAPVPQRKYSHPAYYDSAPAKQGQNQKQNSASSPPNTPRLSARSPNRRKKHSLPNVNIATCATLPVPFINNPYEEDATKSLESAVRKMSRGNSPLFGNSPIANCNSNSTNTEQTCISGLSGLAKGYEQYRESLISLRLTTEYGEASSDDLSSEWEGSNEPSDPHSPVTLKEPLATNLAMNVARRRKMIPNSKNETLEDEDELEHDPKGANSKKDTVTVSNKASATINVEQTKMISKNTTLNPSNHKRPSGWRKVRNMVQWTPFIQTFKNRKYQWVQLAGHSGNFKAGRNQGTVLKKLCPQEEKCYNQFSNDSLNSYVPEYQGKLILDNKEEFIQLQDCLSSFVKPSIMDCKIGVRTYLEEELAKAKEKPKLRKDMFDKMIAVDPAAPTEEERRLKGVTKPRYMVWRETISSTATLGFRIEGVKKSDGTSSKEFKTTKNREKVLDAFSDFSSASSSIVNQYLERLHAIRIALNTSSFFKKT